MFLKVSMQDHLENVFVYWQLVYVSVCLRKVVVCSFVCTPLCTERHVCECV